MILFGGIEIFQIDAGLHTIERNVKSPSGAGDFKNEFIGVMVIRKLQGSDSTYYINYMSVDAGSESANSELKFPLPNLGSIDNGLKYSSDSHYLMKFKKNLPAVNSDALAFEEAADFIKSVEKNAVGTATKTAAEYHTPYWKFLAKESYCSAMNEETRSDNCK